jgi:uncharacterized membrane protein YeaQ/YmgE (transglycosylase-associated protein family)
VVGALLGWVAGWAKGAGRTLLIENMLVAVFGAFIGGDFLVAQLGGVATGDETFHLRSLGLSVAGAVLMLLALQLMRRMVGPMRASKAPAKRRY